MKWYRVVMLFLGCATLQGEDKVHPDEGAPESKMDRLMQAINGHDVTQVKQFLKRMKGEISGEQKQELVALGESLVKKCSKETVLRLSTPDHRSFLFSLGGSLFTGILAYAAYCRCLKNFSVFNELLALDDNRDLGIARRAVTGLAQHRGQVLTPRQIENLAQQAVETEEFSSGRRYPEDAVTDIVANARLDWRAENNVAYNETKKKLENKESDWGLSMLGDLLCGGFFLFCCKKALTAFSCPSAKERLKRATAIKEELQLIAST